MLLASLQHRGSSLTTSVRPRAEKDCKNTQGQVGLDGGHQRPEVGLLRGEMPSWVVFRLTNYSIRQPLASTGWLPCSSRSSRPGSDGAHAAVLAWVPGEMRGTELQTLWVSTTHNLRPSTFSFCPCSYGSPYRDRHQKVSE